MLTLGVAIVLQVLEAQFEAAIVEHARKTGGIMVGDVITFSGHTMLVTAYDELRGRFRLEELPHA